MRYPFVSETIALRRDQNEHVISTELRREQEDAFVVCTDEEDLQAVLPSLGYAREADGAYVRRFPPSDATPAIYQRFSGCISRLLAHLARREPPPWEESLKRLHGRLAAEGVDWMLGGSAALAIRRVAITPRDIDFVVADQTATASALADLLIEPPLRSRGRWIAEWFGRAWDRTRIEWVAETRPDLDDYPRTSDIGRTAVSRAETVEWHGLGFRVPPLDLQLAVARERGLHERVRAIEALNRLSVTTGSPAQAF
jgi:hypothetical protein